MKKKLVALLAAALMTISFAGTAMAAFTDGELIRVVYDSVGSKEYATDLGTWASVTGAANGTVVGGGVDAITLANTGAASLSDLYVGYFLMDKTVSANQFVVAGDANGLTSGAKKFNTSTAFLHSATTNYAVNTIAGTNSAVLPDKKGSNTFFQAQNYAIGAADYGGWTLGTNPGGVLNLAALTTTGYVDQTIYNWQLGNLQSPGTAMPGTAAFTVRTMADGSTILGNNNTAAPVPVPPAFFLMGSGLLGIFGVRRKMNA